MAISRMESIDDRAARILTTYFGSSESVSRRNTLLELGGQGHANLVERRLWAAAWQRLERAGCICPEPGYPADGDVWFLTGYGSQVRGGPIQDYLARDLER